MRRQLASLQTLQAKVKAKDKEWLAALKKEGLSPAQLADLISVLKKSLAKAEKDEKHPQGSAYIPSDPLACGMQAGLTEMAKEEKKVVPSVVPVASDAAVRGIAATRGRRKAAAPDTSPQLSLKSPAKSAPRTRGAGTRGLARGNEFIEGKDPHYALDGIKAKFGALFRKRRKFNNKPAKIAATKKPLTLFVFGDWGTGLPLAAAVTERIREQLEELDGARQPHVIHLGDVYYVGEKQEYIDRMLPFWPVRPAQREAIGSWSLNGNHDMYSGGHGYFDTLLRLRPLIRWHGDETGEPSSFFLIENADWQVFGLDTSWNLPSLGDAIIGDPTLKDYGGQNGILTDSQVRWMARQRNTAKGCIILTHHQPASSRSTENQHADEAIRLLKDAGLYEGIDAWIWGHEHRCVHYKPKAQRGTKRLKDAPEFCACLGHGGVPVTEENFEAQHRISDVQWEEDRFDASAPLYEGQRVLPFGFARIDTSPGSFEFRVFDHSGSERYSFTATRQVAVAPVARGGGTRGGRRGVAQVATAKKAAKKTAKKAKKQAGKKTAKKAIKAAKKTVKRTTAKRAAKTSKRR